MTPPIEPIPPIQIIEISEIRIPIEEDLALDVTSLIDKFIGSNKIKQYSSEKEFILDRIEIVYQYCYTSVLILSGGIIRYENPNYTRELRKYNKDLKAYEKAVQQYNVWVSKKGERDKGEREKELKELVREKERIQAKIRELIKKGEHIDFIDYDKELYKRYC